jgi:hypothetical protein
MAAPDRLDQLVSDFVTSLRTLIRDQAREALEGSFSADSETATKRATPIAKASRAAINGHPRGRGDKRSADEIDGLAEKFLAFVGKHPHLRIEQINAKLGTSTKDLALPIRKLIASGRIKGKGARRARTYSVSAANPVKRKRS